MNDSISRLISDLNACESLYAVCQSLATSSYDRIEIHVDPATGAVLSGIHYLAGSRLFGMNNGVRLNILRGAFLDGFGATEEADWSDWSEMLLDIFEAACREQDAVSTFASA